MSKRNYGNSADAFLLNLTVSDTAAHVSTVLDLRQFDMAGFQLLTDGTLDGAWKVEVSGNYTSANSTGTPYGQAPTTAKWTDITASKLWVDALATVAHGTAATQSQYIQPITAFGARDIRFTFTGSAGTGVAQVICFAKSWST